MTQDPHTGDPLFAFSRLQSLTLETPRVGEFLSQLVALAPRLGAVPLSCSVTVRDEYDDPYTVASDDALSRDVDELQYRHGAGPCLQVLRTGAAAHVPDLHEDHRWEGYRRHASGLGVRSSLSLPLAVGGTVIGTLNLYCTEPEGFDEHLRRLLGVYAVQAAAALTMVLREAHQDPLTAQLERAIASRTAVDHALGILMARNRCTADQAFALLVSRARDTDREVLDVATDLVHGVTGAPPPHDA